MTEPFYKSSLLPLRIAVPHGHLLLGSLRLLADVGIPVDTLDSNPRCYKLVPIDNHIELALVRAIEVPWFVGQGLFQLGVCGLDCILEISPRNLVQLLDLGFGQTKLILAAPDHFGVRSFDELLDYFKGTLTIATEYPNITIRYVEGQTAYQRLTSCKPNIVSPWFQKNTQSPVTVVWSMGCSEGKVPVIADCVVDTVDTGRTLKANGLTIVDTVLPRSSAWLIADKTALRKNVHRVHFMEIVDRIQEVLKGQKAMENENLVEFSVLEGGYK